MFRFNHDFEPVNKADADRIAEEIETAEHIKKLRDMRSKAEVTMESYSLTLDEACQFLRYPDQPPPTGYEQAAYRQHVKIQPNQNLLTSQHGKPALRRFSLRCILSGERG